MSRRDGDADLWDTGVQIERTSLAWLRTILAFVVAAMVLIRLMAGRLSGLVVVSCGVIVMVAVLFGVLSWRRYLTSHRRLHLHSPLPDGMLPLAAASAALTVESTALTYILAERLP